MLLVGHSCRGAVITNAATSAPNVVGLVFVAAFAPEQGETLSEVENGSKDSGLGTALVQYTYPAGPGGQLPSWAVVAIGDKAAGTDVVRSQARRPGADIIEVEGPHVIMISQSQAVTDHILKAYRAVAGSAG